MEPEFIIHHPSVIQYKGNRTFVFEVQFPLSWIRDAMKASGITKEFSDGKVTQEKIIFLGNGMAKAISSGLEEYLTGIFGGQKHSYVVKFNVDLFSGLYSTQNRYCSAYVAIGENVPGLIDHLATIFAESGIPANLAIPATLSKIFPEQYPLLPQHAMLFEHALAAAIKQNLEASAATLYASDVKPQFIPRRK